MIQKTLNLKDVMTFIERLPYIQFKQVVERYVETQNSDFSDMLNQLTISNFEQRLEYLDINRFCPSCSSENIVKNGRKNQIQQFKCKDCQKRFTRFSGTILEKTRLHWDVWVKVLEMTLNHYSIKKMVHVLVGDYGCEGIDDKTVWYWRLKLLHALD